MFHFILSWTSCEAIIAEEPSIHSRKKQFGESDVSNTICHSVKVRVQLRVTMKMSSQSVKERRKDSCWGQSLDPRPPARAQTQTQLWLFILIPLNYGLAIKTARALEKVWHKSREGGWNMRAIRGSVHIPRSGDNGLCGCWPPSSHIPQPLTQTAD